VPRFTRQVDTNLQIPALQTLDYLNSDWLARPAVEVAPDLIGCWVVRQAPGGQVWRGLIVETEAYGPGDPACHGYRQRTKRNWPMFGAPGLVYVYLIYGVYHCLNIVTEADGIASAVLIRALSLDPETIMNLTDHPQARPVTHPHRWAAGPGKLCRMFGITRELSGQKLGQDAGLWLEPKAGAWEPNLIQTTRIGLTQGQERPWRWYQNSHPAVSRP